jgi:hypothetical protein
MKRGCFISAVALLGLCLVGCAVVYFVAIPRVRDSARDGVRDAIGTTVAQQIPSDSTGAAEPGAYTITEADIQAQITENMDVSNVDDLVIQITPTGLEFGVQTDSNQNLSYTGVPVVENGLLRMRGMEASDGVMDWIFPAEDLGTAIEDAVNNYLAQHSLRLESLHLADGEMTLVTVPAT